MKKLLAILMASLLCLSGTALAGENDPDDVRNVISQKQNAGAFVGTEEDGPFGRYADPVKLTFIKSTDSTAMTKYGKMEELFGETLEDNRWTRLFKDVLNIEVEYLWTADISQYDQKWKLALASGEIPDVSPIKSKDLRDLFQMEEAGLIQDIQPYWDTYASDLTKTIVAADNGDAVYSAITSTDGKMLGVPEVSAALDTYRYLWIRTDWLEKLNLKTPKTLDDLKRIMEAFATQDPDGNGVNDTYSYLIGKALWYQLEGLFWCFGAYPDTWLPDENGRLVYGATLPEMKEALHWLQEMYANGWIDPEFVVKDDVKANEMIVSGKTGMTSGGHWIVLSELAQSRELDPEASWGVFSWPTADGSEAMGETELGLDNVLAVSASCDHPEAVIKMLNLYYEMLYGASGNYSYWGNDYSHAEEGKAIEGVWALGPMYSFHPMINILPYRDAVKVVNGEMAVEDLQGASLDYWNNCQVDWGWSREWIPSKDAYKTAGDHIDHVLKEGLLFTDSFVGAKTETMVERFSSMQEMMDTTMTKIITGNLDVDKGFDDFVKSWYAMGGTAITEEVNTWYDGIKAN